MAEGQVVIPKRIRRERGWESGLGLVVETTSDSLMLRPLDARRVDVCCGSSRHLVYKSTKSKKSKAKRIELTC